MDRDIASITSGKSTTTAGADTLAQPLQRLVDARHHDPFEVLGRHEEDGQCLLRAFLPHCSEVRVRDPDLELRRIEGTDLFEWRGDGSRIAQRYQLTWVDRDGLRWTEYDPYCFAPGIADLDLHLFGEGRHLHAYRMLGAHACEVHGVS
ncbi:MAG: 1,4-alpha-glucan branching enzyme, partial [Thiogranum sp.]